LLSDIRDQQPHQTIHHHQPLRSSVNSRKQFTQCGIKQYKIIDSPITTIGALPARTEIGAQVALRNTFVKVECRLQIANVTERDGLTKTYKTKNDTNAIVRFFEPQTFKQSATHVETSWFLSRAKAVDTATACASTSLYDLATNDAS
jgi:hypothetical protein